MNAVANSDRDVPQATVGIAQGCFVLRAQQPAIRRPRVKQVSSQPRAVLRCRCTPVLVDPRDYPEAVLPTDNGRELHIRNVSAPEPAHRELYQERGIPATVMRPRRIWVIPEGSDEKSPAQPQAAQ